MPLYLIKQKAGYKTKTQKIQIMEVNKMEIVLSWKDNEKIAIGMLRNKGIWEIDYPKIRVGMTGYQFKDTQEVREVLAECGLTVENLYYHFCKRGYYV